MHVIGLWVLFFVVIAWPLWREFGRLVAWLLIGAAIVAALDRILPDRLDGAHSPPACDYACKVERATDGHPFGR